MMSHMMTSAPSLPPRRMKSSMLMPARRSGSRSIRSRNSRSHFSSLNPARSPIIWCDRPPVPTMAPLKSGFQSGSSCLPLSCATPIVGTWDVPMPPMMRAISRFYSRHAVLELADLLDPELHRLARAQEALARHADARGRAGHDEIARLQRDARGQHLDLLRDGEDHLVAVRILHQLIPDPQLEPELLRIADLGSWHDPRPERTGAVEAFLAHPVEVERTGRRVLLAAAGIARREVVADGVAKHIVQRLRQGDILGRLADDGDQLDFPVDRFRERRQLDGRTPADDRALAGLDEVPGLLAQLLHRRARRIAVRARHLRHVVGVVGAGAEDVAGIRYGRREPRILHRLRAPFGRDRFLRAQRVDYAGKARFALEVEDLAIDRKAAARAAFRLVAEQAIGHSCFSFAACVTRLKKS